MDRLKFVSKMENYVSDLCQPRSWLAKISQFSTQYLNIKLNAKYMNLFGTTVSLFVLICFTKFEKVNFWNDLYIKDS